MSSHSPQHQFLKIQFTDWLSSFSISSSAISDELQRACLEDSLEAFCIHFPLHSSLQQQKDYEMRWLLNKWISNITLLLDSQTNDALNYRGIEIPKGRFEDIKHHLLNDIRKTVAACYRSKSKFIN